MRAFINLGPFGLTGAPRMFQQLMSLMLSGLEEFTMSYIDDILVFSNVLTSADCVWLFEKAWAKVKVGNHTSFLRIKTNYLGFVINKNGVIPDIDTVDEISDNPRAVYSEGSYAIHWILILRSSRKDRPLINLTKKYAWFKWTTECQSSFDALKQLTSVSLLTYPDRSKLISLYIDVSGIYTGACYRQPCLG